MGGENVTKYNGMVTGTTMAKAFTRSELLDLMFAVERAYRSGIDLRRGLKVKEAKRLHRQGYAIRQKIINL